MTNKEMLSPALTMARRCLAILEDQAAGYGKLALEVPMHLQIDLEEKRLQIAKLEARLNKQ